MTVSVLVCKFYFVSPVKGELRWEGHSLHLVDFAMRASVPIQNIVLDLALLANVKSSNFKNEYGQSSTLLKWFKV